jgi:hypothetical protein
LSTAITLQTPSAALSISEGRRSVDQLVAQRSAIVEAMQKVMRPDVDYGKVPGTDKPSLWKPGSEKILSMFNLAVTPTVEDLSTPDCIRYRVHASIHHIPTGNVMGVGVGEASSAEAKYQWRKVVCVEEWDATPTDRRRIKWKNGSGGKAYSVSQVRADPEDVANTVLKMAKKRAQIDATLTCTAASDVFSQDLEELREADIEVGDEEHPSTTSTSRPEDLQRKAPPTAPAQQTETQGKIVGGGPLVSPEQAKRWWGVALKTHNDYKLLTAFLRDRLGVANKDFMTTGQYEAAMAWAEGRAQ